jgi:hypothetical protein
LEPGKETRYIEDMKNYAEEVGQFDVVVLLLTEANLSRFGFGMQQAYLKKGLK